MAQSGREPKCPFCGAGVDEDLLLYGGSCPKCFGEIPGEEAATDPGAVVRAKQAASDKRRMWVKALIPVALSIPVVFGVFVLAIGFVFWNRNPTVELMNFDDDAAAFEYEIVSAPPEPEPGTVKPVAPVPVKPRPVSNDGVADAGPASLPRPDVPAPRPRAGGLSFDGLGTRAYREGEVLSDPGQIYEMVKLKMTGFQGQLNECYERRLKMRPEVQGRWRANFVVGTDGFPTGVSFTGVNMKDEELEQCLAGKVSRWRFSRITQPQPVQKTWTFRAG